MHAEYLSSMAMDDALDDGQPDAGAFEFLARVQPNYGPWLADSSAGSAD